MRLKESPAPFSFYPPYIQSIQRMQAHNIAAERDTVSTRPDAVATTTTSDDNNAAVVASAVELPRQDVCPAPDSWWYVVLSTAKCYTGERDDRSLLTDSDHEPAASSQPPLAEDEVETGTSSELPLAVGDMEVVSSSQLLSGDGEEGSAPLSRPTSSLSLVEGGTPSGGSEREVRCGNCLTYDNGWTFPIFCVA